MKLKKIFSMAVVILGLVALISTSVGAAEEWHYNVQVEAIGAFSNDAWNATWAALTNLDTQQSAWFMLHGTNAKQMLAAGLTAKSAGAKVWALCDFDAPGLVYGLMLAE